MNCLFCTNINKEQILLETAFFMVIFDIDAIQSGHLLILSKKHYESLLEIPQVALLDLMEIEKKVIRIIESAFNPLGVSIIQNNGAIMDEGTHFHVHIIARYAKDGFWDNQEVVQHPLDLKLLKQLLATEEC